MGNRHRRPKLDQVVPPPPRFQVVEFRPGDNYWTITIQDPTDANDRPTWRHDVARSRQARRFSPDELARAGAGECMGRRGLVFLTEHRDGIPVATFCYASNSRQVFPIASSDHERVRPVELQGLAGRAARALSDALLRRHG